MNTRRRQSGFSLIEAIIVMVIVGIVGAMVAVFIRAPVEGYVDTARRAELTDAADVALRRMMRDIRLALPNSLRVTTSGANAYIEFIMTSAGGRYRDATDGSTAGDFLSFTSTTDTSFDVLGAMPTIAANDFIVIYNLGPGYAPADAYAGGNRAQVSGVASSTVTLAANPFAAQTPPLPSPNARFQVVPGGTKAVSYVCPTATRGELQRYANYGFNANQTTSFSITPALLVANAICDVEYTANATGRNGLLYIRLTLTDPAGGESVALFQQIHVDNSP